MLRKTDIRFTVLVLTIWCGSANAGLMDPVRANGNWWLQPADFLAYTWNDMSAVCDPTTGLCSGYLGEIDLTDWTWAGVEDMNALFNSYLQADLLGPGPTNIDGFEAGQAVAEFYEDPWLPTECIDFDDDTLCLTFGIYKDYRDSRVAYTAGVGGVCDGSVCEFADVWTRGTIEKDDTGSGVGGWFYHSADVPAPTTLALLSLVFSGLAWSTRKKI